MSVHFLLFFDHYHTRLVRLAMVFVPCYQQAEDIVSEVFLKLLRKRAALLTIQHLEGYLFKMVKHEALAQIKSEGRHVFNVPVDDIQDYLSADAFDPKR